MSGSSSFRIQLHKYDLNEIEREAEREREGARKAHPNNTSHSQLIHVANVFLVVLSTISDAVSSARQQTQIAHLLRRYFPMFTVTFSLFILLNNWK